MNAVQVMNKERKGNEEFLNNEKELYFLKIVDKTIIKTE